MIFKLTRSSGVRRLPPGGKEITEIEINSLEELLNLIDSENNNIQISTKDDQGYYWIEIDDFFND